MRTIIEIDEAEEKVNDMIVVYDQQQKKFITSTKREFTLEERERLSKIELKLKTQEEQIKKIFNNQKLLANALKEEQGND